MTRRLAREEGMFVGGSSGAAVAGAIKWLRRQEEPLRAVVLLPDSGSRYMSKIYNDQWMKENGFLEPETRLGTVAEVLKTIGERETVSVDDTMPVTEAIGLMKLHGISQMPVTRDGKLVGMIHERSLLEAALRTRPGIQRTGDLADQNYCTVSRDTEVAVVSDLMRRVRCALVMDEGKLAGVLTRIDIIDHVARVGLGGA
jgi:cystathionine beta-synthase